MSPPLLPTAAVRPAHNWRQLAVVCALIVPEAMQGNVLSPFLPFLVRRYWHLPERDTALYVGLLSGAFFLAQALTTPAWGYCSDRIGRRPVILISLLGSALGAYAFATARTFRVACLARLFVGFFDAHLAITKTYITEASDVSTVASGFALLSVMWGVGQTIAPLVGGFLADPASRFSGVSWAVFPLVAEYPYALPSLFSCACSLAALFAAWTWLQDTAVFSKARSATAEDPPDGVNGRGAGTDVAVNTAAIEPAAAPAAVSAALPHMTFRELCVTPAITGTVLCYVLMSAYQVMFDAMTPVLLQLRPEAGGLGYSSAAIGLSQLWAGITPIVAQLIFVPHAIRTYGPLRCYRTTMLASLAFAALPVVCLAAASGAPPWSVFALLSVAQVARAAVTALAFTSCNVLLGMSGQVRGGRWVAADLAMSIGWSTPPQHLYPPTLPAPRPSFSRGAASAP